MALNREQSLEIKQNNISELDHNSTLELMISSVVNNNDAYTIEKFKNILSYLETLHEYHFEIIDLVIQNLNRLTCMEIELETLLEGKINIPQSDLKKIIKGQVIGVQNLVTLAQAGLLEQYRENIEFADEIVELKKCNLLTNSNVQKLKNYQNPSASIGKMLADLREVNLATQENFVKLIEDKIGGLNADSINILRKYKLLTQYNFNNLINISNQNQRRSLCSAIKILGENNLNNQEYFTLLIKHPFPLTVAQGFQHLINANLFTLENQNALMETLQKGENYINLIFDALIAADIFNQENFLKILNKAKYTQPLYDHIVLLQNNNLFSVDDKELTQQNLDKLLRFCQFSEEIIQKDEVTQQEFDDAMKKIEKEIDKAEINKISTYLSQGLKAKSFFFQLPKEIVTEIAIMSAGNGALEEKERCQISYQIVQKHA